MRDFSQDLLIAWRSLLRRPAFAMLAAVTLAAGIPLNVIVASLLDTYLIRSLPYPESGRLHDTRYSAPNEQPPRGPDSLDWSAIDSAVEHRISWDLDMFYLVGAKSESVPGAWVTPGFMAGLGIQPHIGRAFNPHEFSAGGAQVAVISHAL